jgi:hypothetical protein
MQLQRIHRPDDDLMRWKHIVERTIVIHDNVN